MLLMSQLASLNCCIVSAGSNDGAGSLSEGRNETDLEAT